MSATESSQKVISPRKLIEVALPLDSINVACAREKSIRHGHPSTLHLWWARRPLAAARAVIFSQLVNDPAGLWEVRNPGQTPSSQQRSAFTKRRKELFSLIEELVLWVNTTNEEVLQRARNEIQRSWKEVCELNSSHPQAAELFNPAKMPGLHDPFAGGGAIPLEAQRLGLEAWASDLNPVAVLINKAMIEIPPKFAGRPPVGPLPNDEVPHTKTQDSWSGVSGLAEDVRRYGAWMREEAFKRIGYLYPKVKIVPEMAEERPDLKPLIGQELKVIAWLWARTVKSPNPAFSHVDVPLVSSFILSSKPGKEAWVEPIVEGDNYRFNVRVGRPPATAKEGTKLARGANFKCILSSKAIEDKYIKAESLANRMGDILMAIVAEGTSGRIYLTPEKSHQQIARSAHPVWKPEQAMNRDTTNLVSGRGYGFYTWGDLFTARQLVSLTTFSDLVSEARDKVRADAIAVKALPVNNDLPLDQSGTGPNAYAEAVSVYLALAVSKMADAQTSLCRWKPSMDQSIATFGRQALPMVWDFSEANALGGMAGDFFVSLSNMMRVLDRLGVGVTGNVKQADAQTQSLSILKQISTDPPYYDNIA
ncbi:MAG TPA: DUF1156 domain-containing protein, partial [Candidatus Rifleibacterium sp.]|nr:DUF1156 domain-containing protein [Candidatus Rifleibacterium sp.]